MDYDKIIDINFDNKMHKVRDNGLLLSYASVNLITAYSRLFKI